jgi:drug/metabolite transporter (DMT)-like permease
MKTQQVLLPFVLAFIAAIGNALVTIGQKKATPINNPFLFGAMSLCLASVILFTFSLFFKNESILPYVKNNMLWISVSAFGLVLLNVFLYILYRNFGANLYTLYAVLAISTTSIGASVIIFKERWNVYYGLSLITTVITILLFLKGKNS